MSKLPFNEYPDGKFDPMKAWVRSLSFIHRPGATKEQVDAACRSALSKLEDEMKEFVPYKFRGRVQFFVVSPKPPKEGRIGWRYTPHWSVGK